jgi:hypothetical protein
MRSRNVAESVSSLAVRRTVRTCSHRISAMTSVHYFHSGAHNAATAWGNAKPLTESTVNGHLHAQKRMARRLAVAPVH